MLKDYAQVLYDELQKLLTDELITSPEIQPSPNSKSNLQPSQKPKLESKNETDEFPF